LIHFYKRHLDWVRMAFRACSALRRNPSSKLLISLGSENTGQIRVCSVPTRCLHGPPRSTDEYSDTPLYPPIPQHKDKKERKKQQNVEAARRYRDKKKSELLNVESVEQTLADKNKGLKSEVADLEVKVRTMKQLMVELGILKA